MSEEKAMTDKLFDPFFKTGFSYEYKGEGDVKITTSGFIQSVIFKDDILTALFRSPLTEKYMVHASAGKDIVYACNANENGFSIKSSHCVVRHFPWVLAIISKVPHDFLIEYIRGTQSE